MIYILFVAKNSRTVWLRNEIGILWLASVFLQALYWSSAVLRGSQSLSWYLWTRNGSLALKKFNTHIAHIISGMALMYVPSSKIVIPKNVDSSCNESLNESDVLHPPTFDAQIVASSSLQITFENWNHPKTEFPPESLIFADEKIRFRSLANFILRKY